LITSVLENINDERSIRRTDTVGRSGSVFACRFAAFYRATAGRAATAPRDLRATDILNP
jgi:hypothetical protein